MKKKYITPMTTVVKTDMETLLAGGSPHQQAVHLFDKTTQSEQYRSTVSSGADVNQFLFGISDGGGTPNAKDSEWDLWEE